jgi:hypothetical protein
LAPDGRRLSPWLNSLLPSVADLLFLTLLFALSCGALGRLLLRDAGTGWHIRNGELMLAAHAITRIDPFSSTVAGHAWYAWEWLYDAGVAVIYSLFGLNGVVFFTAAVIASTFVLALRVALAAGGSLPVSSALVLIAILASTLHFLARPHVLSWLLAVIWFALLDSSSRDPRLEKRLFWLPPLMLLWVNVHGGFLLGFVLLAIYWLAAWLSIFAPGAPDRGVRARLRYLSLIAGLTFASSLLNPFGYKLYLHVFSYLSNSFLMNHIVEFQSPNFHSGSGRGFALLLILTLVTACFSPRRLSAAHLLVVAFAVASGLYAARNLPVSSILLVLVLAPLLSRAVESGAADLRLAPALRRLFSRLRSFSARMGYVELHLRAHLWLLLAFVAGLWACAHGGKIGSVEFLRAYFDPARFPVQAASALAARQGSEPVFSPDWWGGYLIYRLYPGRRVVVDDRHDLYGEKFLRDYLKAIEGQPGWNTLLDRESVDVVLVPADSPLTTILKQSPQWSVQYEDKVAVLFERARGQSSGAAPPAVASESRARL